MYKLRANTHAYLPPFVYGTTDLVAIHRPDTPLACARVGISAQLTNRNLQGECCAELQLGPFDYQVVTQPGNQFIVATLDVVASEEQVDQSYAAFRLGVAVNATLDRPIASVVNAFWQQRGQVISVHELWRRRNALVLGQIAPNVGAKAWLETDNGQFLAEPGSYVIQEFSGRGVRIVPHTYMGREFETLRTPFGEVVEEFIYTRG